MRTEIEVPDELMDQVRSLAAQRGERLSDFLCHALERAIAEDRTQRIRAQVEAIAQQNAAAWNTDKSPLEQLFEDRAARCP